MSEATWLRCASPALPTRTSLQSPSQNGVAERFVALSCAEHRIPLPLRDRVPARSLVEGNGPEEPAVGEEHGDEEGLRHETAVGRKNRYGSRSERGTCVAALFYSLIESAKLCGVEPRAYLREATLRAVRNPGTATLARDLKSPRS